MTRAKRDMQENMKAVDMVIELRDCRIPESSRNPMLDQIIQNKPRLIVLSKKDKGEAAEIEKWIQHLSNETTTVIAMDLTKDAVISTITNACTKIMQPKIDRMIRRGIRPRAIRAMVCGIPNVGKSTLINAVAKKKIAETADRPGVTRSLKWMKLNKNLELLDTPGILWPKFEDEKVGYHLAITGAIRDQILPLEDVVRYAIKRLIKEYPERLQERYGIEVCDDADEVLMRIGKARNFVKSGSEVDIKRTMEVFLNELRDDRLGCICWERVNENN